MEDCRHHRRAITDAVPFLTERGRDRSIHVLPAVDTHRRSGNECAILRSQERNAAGDLVSLTEAANRDLGNNLLQYRRRHGGDHVGVDVARRDGVHGHAKLGAFLRQCLGEAMDARFGGGIVALAILARLPVDRADIDDTAPTSPASAGKPRLFQC